MALETTNMLDEKLTRPSGKKDVQKYDRKLTSMKKYAPFLQKVVRKLEKKKIKVRTRHVSAARAFYSLLTESNIRIKLDNLTKLEKLLKRLYTNKRQLGIYSRTEKAAHAKSCETKGKSRIKSSQKPKVTAPLFDRPVVLMLCPVCKGHRKIRDRDECFACSGIGRLRDSIAEEWWAVMFQHLCDPTVILSSKNWPKSVLMTCLPTDWKGSPNEVEISKKDEETWHARLLAENPEALKTTEGKMWCKQSTKEKRKRVRRSKAKKEQEQEKLKHTKNRQRFNSVMRRKNVPVLASRSNSTSESNFTNFYPMNNPNGGNETYFSRAQQPPNMWSWPNNPSVTMDAVLPPDESDMHLCPVCHGHGCLYDFGPCSACRAGRLLTRQEAAYWWDQVTRNRNGLHVSYGDNTLPYNLGACDLPTIWLGSPEQVKAAIAASVYWEHAVQQWCWFVGGNDINAAATSAVPPPNLLNVGGVGPTVPMPPLVPELIHQAPYQPVNKKGMDFGKKGMDFGRKRTLTAIPRMMFENEKKTPESSSSIVKFNSKPKLSKALLKGNLVQITLDPTQNLTETTEDQTKTEPCDSASDDNSLIGGKGPELMLCSFCRGHRFIAEKPCPACASQGSMARVQAKQWWRSLTNFREALDKSEAPQPEVWKLPEELKWEDLPQTWCGSESIIEKSEKQIADWESELKKDLVQVTAIKTNDEKQEPEEKE